MVLGLCVLVLACQKTAESPKTAESLDSPESIERREITEITELTRIPSVKAHGTPEGPAKQTIVPEPEKQETFYVVEDLRGSAQILEYGSDRWQDASQEDMLGQGDEIRVGSKGQVTLTLDSETTVQLFENSRLIVSSLEPVGDGGMIMRLKLSAGRVITRLRKLLARGSEFQIEAADVVCGVRGTIFEVGFEGEVVQTATQEGVIEVSYASGVQRVSAGQFAAFRKGRRMALRKLKQKEQKRFTKFMKHRLEVHKRRLNRIKRLRNPKNSADRIKNELFRKKRTQAAKRFIKEKIVPRKRKAVEKKMKQTLKKNKKVRKEVMKKNAKKKIKRKLMKNKFRKKPAQKKKKRAK